jgi:ceramide glucosyltransferase
MTLSILAATAFCTFATALHFAGIGIAIWRFRSTTPGASLPGQQKPPVSLVRPVCGIDNYDAETLRTTFELDYPQYEILFCVASATDPVVALVNALIAEFPQIDASLLIGDDHICSNPKLNNVLKGWKASRYDWVVIADSNVLIPRDYVQQLFANWREDTGLVASPPVGCRPESLWAELECAFLNNYQARWQYCADALGFGFAQGKTMLWRRADLEAAGGIAALAREVAEDAASTKVVRGAGLKVRLVDRPFQQPLGKRSLSEVWNRQLRWSRLRRASFLPLFLPEGISGGVWPMLTLAIICHALGLPALPAVAALFIAWYGSEMLLAAVAGWHIAPAYPLFGFIRDIMIPILFVKALRGTDFVWRGNEMQVERIKARRALARVRPGLNKLAPVARRRLKSLRARMS